MKRTRLLLVVLTVIVVLLGVLKLTYRPSSLESLSSPTPAVSAVPTSFPTATPLPTPSNENSFQSVDNIFSFTYPDSWNLKRLSADNMLPDRWQLTTPTTSSSASEVVFDFNLSLASRSAAFSSSCPASDTNCQILTLNQVPYQLTATLNLNQVASIRYTATAGAYLINITGSMNQSQAETYLDDWDQITQSFTFTP